MRSLGVRLSAIARLVPQGARVCDVGTDHGYLAAELLLSGRASSVTATDINAAPLENARKNLEKLKMENRVKLVLCDGLSGVKKEDADTVVIAGMGGDVISGIISRCDFAFNSGVLLILQPMTAAAQLRSFLGERGFAVEYETAVCENKKVYSVMTARFCGKPYKTDAVRRRIGILRPDTEENRAYIEKQYTVCLDCLSAMGNSHSENTEYLEIKGAAEELRRILED